MVLEGVRGHGSESSTMIVSIVRPARIPRGGCQKLSQRSSQKAAAARRKTSQSRPVIPVRRASMDGTIPKIPGSLPVGREAMTSRMVKRTRRTSRKKSNQPVTTQGSQPPRMGIRGRAESHP